MEVTSQLHVPPLLSTGVEDECSQSRLGHCGREVSSFADRSPNSQSSSPYPIPYSDLVSCLHCHMEDIYSR
jgi:hypothetical protein